MPSRLRELPDTTPRPPAAFGPLGGGARSPSACRDCGTETIDCDAPEYYMVQHDLWISAGVGDGLLCIGCLEDRLGRRLESCDFTDAPINVLPVPRSARLQERLRS